MRKKLSRIESAEPILHGVLKIAFVDGYQGIVDLRPLIAKGGVFVWAQKAKSFQSLKVDEFGHSISWTDAKGYENRPERGQPATRLRTAGGDPQIDGRLTLQRSAVNH